MSRDQTPSDGLWFLIKSSTPAPEACRLFGYDQNEAAINPTAASHLLVTSLVAQGISFLMSKPRKHFQAEKIQSIVRGRPAIARLKIGASFPAISLCPGYRRQTTWTILIVHFPQIALGLRHDKNTRYVSPCVQAEQARPGMIAVQSCRHELDRPVHGRFKGQALKCNVTRIRM